MPNYQHGRWYHSSDLLTPVLAVGEGLVVVEVGVPSVDGEEGVGQRPARAVEGISVAVLPGRELNINVCIT